MTHPAPDELLARLNRASVTRRFDAYRDVDWDAPEYRVDPDDPRWERPADCGDRKSVV